MLLPMWLQSGKDKYGYLTHDQIDCSHLLNSVLKDAGCSVPYLSTGEFKGPAGQLSDEGNKYFKQVSGDAVKAGDIVLFDGHIGFVESYDPKTGAGTFWGSQTSTGPASVHFGPGTGYWDKPYDILEIKPQYCPDSMSQSNDADWTQVADNTTENIISPSSSEATDSITDSAEPREASQNAAEMSAASETPQDKLTPDSTTESDEQNPPDTSSTDDDPASDDNDSPDNEDDDQTYYADDDPALDAADDPAYDAYDDQADYTDDYWT